LKITLPNVLPEQDYCTFSTLQGIAMHPDVCLVVPEYTFQHWPKPEGPTTTGDNSTLPQTDTTQPPPTGEHSTGSSNDGEDEQSNGADKASHRFYSLYFVVGSLMLAELCSLLL